VTVKDLEKVARDASNGQFTKNSRQTKIVLIKALAAYINENHHPLKGMGALKDIKAGAASRHTKGVLSPEEWGTVINTPVSAKDRAAIAMLYDGYHRPMEILQLKWSDLKINKTGGIEYTLTFKTEKPRTIVMKPQATSALELWRQELGAKIGDDIPLFPDSDGKPYQTITILKQLCNRLKEKSGINKIMPSIFRNSAITHDIQAGLPVSYVCMRAWGESYNERINVYADPDSSQMQRDQHDKNGISTIKISPAALRKASEIRECPSCNVANPATMVYCGVCGGSLDASVPSPQTAITNLQNKMDRLETNIQQFVIFFERVRADPTIDPVAVLNLLKK